MKLTKLGSLHIKLAIFVESCNFLLFTKKNSYDIKKKSKLHNIKEEILNGANTGKSAS